MGKFRIRLLILIAALILLGQGFTALAIMAVSGRDAELRAARELDETLARMQSSSEARAARDRRGLLLALESMPREPVQLQHSLRRYGEAIGYGETLIVSEDGLQVWATPGLATPLVTAAVAANAGGTGSDQLNFLFAVSHGDVYQVLLVPLSSPPNGVRTWVGLGLHLDEEFLRRWSSEQSTQPSLIVGDEPFEAPDRGIAQRRGADVRALMNLPAVNGHVSVELRKSLDVALAPYLRIRTVMFVISGVALFGAVFIALFMGASATRPIDTLVRAARRIEEGNYTEPVEITEGAVEFTRLAQSLNAMQARIAEREARIQHQANHDQLTGLLNLHAVLTQLSLILGQSVPVAMVLIDIRRFRDVNASLGPLMGNRLLVQFSRQLSTLAGAGNVVARVSGDEFMVMLPGAGLGEAHGLAERVLAAARAGMRVANHTLKFDLRIGYCAAPEHGTVPNELLFRADIAREEARNSGLAIKAYQPGRDEGYRRRLTLLDELRQAITEDRLSLVYQPQVYTKTRRVKSFEALARWQHPQLGWIPPSEFIALAEQSGSIAELTRWVLRKAISQLADWHRQGLQVDIAVNLSPTDLMDRELPQEVLALLRHHRIPAQNLVIELTESAVLREPDTAARVMETLRAAGVRFSIDDFGTGYSSLAQLQTLPVDELKIDRSFILDLEKGEGSDAIVRSTIELGHTLGLKVVAEGIENGRVWAKLLSLGCDYGQGYFVSRPMTPEKVLPWTLEMNARLAAATSDTAQVRALSEAS